MAQTGITGRRALGCRVRLSSGGAGVLFVFVEARANVADWRSGSRLFVRVEILCNRVGCAKSKQGGKCGRSLAESRVE